MAQLIPKPIAPVRLFEDNGCYPSSVAIFPDRRRMVTGSTDGMVRLWDMREGVVLKRMQGHSNPVMALVVSRDGRLIASGDSEGELIAWDADIGVSLTQAIKAHSDALVSLDFSPDSSMLASCSYDTTTKLWCTKSWELLGNPITCSAPALCIRFSPSGELLAVATDSNIQIYNPGTRQCVANFKAHAGWNTSLTWTPDGTRLFSAGGKVDPTIREWDSSTWCQVGYSWKGHFEDIKAISLNSNGTLLASASYDHRVRLWQVSDQRTTVVFDHSATLDCVAFSADDRHILSGGADKKISEWPVSEKPLLEDSSKGGPKDKDDFKEQLRARLKRTLISRHVPTFESYNAMRTYFTQVLAINPAVRDAWVAGDLPAAEKALNREIDADANNYISYANRAFVMARKGDWNRALLDSIKSVTIQPSFAGHVSKGIALCGKGQVRAANTAFDLASVFTNGDLKTSHFLFLIKTIALFNANEHEEAMLRIGELAVSPNVNPVACRIVEACLRIELGVLASSNHSEAVDHFTAAVNASASFHTSEIHSTYEEFIVLFGWDLKSLWQTANQQQCYALIRAGRIGAGVELYQSMIDKSDETTRASLRAWFSELYLE